MHKEVEDVRLQIEPLLRTKPVPRLFIKDKPNMDRKEAETGQPMINKWSVYTAYRYCAVGVVRNTLCFLGAQAIYLLTCFIVSLV